MESTNVFVLGLLAGLGIAYFYRSHTNTASNTPSSLPPSINKTKNKKKNKNKPKQQDVSPSLSPISSPSSSSPIEPTIQQADKAVNPSSQTENLKRPQVQQQQQKQKQRQVKQAPIQVNGKQNKQQLEETQEDKEKKEIPKVTKSEAWTNDDRRRKLQAGQEILHAQLDDMRDEEVDPTCKYNHVASIPARVENEPQAVVLTEQDRDDGWENVGSGGSKLRSMQPNGNGTTTQTRLIASTNPFAALPTDADSSHVRRLPATTTKINSSSKSDSSWIPAGSKSSSNLQESQAIKKQRQNSAKAAAKKSAKEAEEHERLERLARHRREQEREKVKAMDKSKQPKPFSVPAIRESAKASVSLGGKLVWE